jgi:hypothetical protein
MTPAEKATVAYLDKNVQATALEIATATCYRRDTITHCLASLRRTGQVLIVDPDARVRSYILAGDVCFYCGQVIR